MKIYLAKKHSPFYTLTMEEMLVKDPEQTDDIVYFYQHENAVIIGRNQNVYEEVKIDELEKNNVELYRRLSGGGAVYHDLGNINFSFITKKSEGQNYEKFLQPILEFLKSLGVNAYFKGRNDLVIDDLKFSGNAQFIWKDKIVHHGTLLFDANLEKLGNYLIPSKLKMQSKGIKSARQRVTNINDTLPNKMSVNHFINGLIGFFEKKYDSKLEELPSKYDQEIKKLAEYKKSKDWIFKKQFPFSVTNEAKYDSGILKVKYSVKENRFENIVFEGDFLALTDHDVVRDALIGSEYDKKETTKILEKFENLKEMFGGLTIGEIVLTIYGE
ncbi:lipoate--protein ligase [[Mycoplasma] gypis]|uniref:lipoate--protein ligase n=1 Tax=[Mycoplasma] gypis TaxID=92404 RepID=A0ABZ2RND5_9BACT|nr:lipoate--protein ligase [[Mycoplasma] gypis]MBN0919327.1 lipoate--protein ligase [[Mycoplasma] gypis]